MITFIIGAIVKNLYHISDEAATIGEKQTPPDKQMAQEW